MSGGFNSKIGLDFKLSLKSGLHIKEGDWLGLFLVGQDDSDWGSHW
jgi:hypothetical protein